MLAFILYEIIVVFTAIKACKRFQYGNTRNRIDADQATSLKLLIRIQSVQYMYVLVNELSEININVHNEIIYRVCADQTIVFTVTFSDWHPICLAPNSKFLYYAHVYQYTASLFTNKPVTRECLFAHVYFNENIHVCDTKVCISTCSCFLWNN